MKKGNWGSSGGLLVFYGVGFLFLDGFPGWVLWVGKQVRAGVRAALRDAPRHGVGFPRTSSAAADSGLGYFRCVPPGRALGEDAPGMTESNRRSLFDSLVEDELTQGRLSVA